MGICNPASLMFPILKQEATQQASYCIVYKNRISRFRYYLAQNHCQGFLNYSVQRLTSFWQFSTLTKLLALNYVLPGQLYIMVADWFWSSYASTRPFNLQKYILGWRKLQSLCYFRCIACNRTKMHVPSEVYLKGTDPLRHSEHWRMILQHERQVLYGWPILELMLLVHQCFVLSVKLHLYLCNSEGQVNFLWWDGFDWQLLGFTLKEIQG